MSAAGGLYDANGAEANPTSEEFTLAVEAENVLDADRNAWATLESYLGHDPVGAWRLSEMKHGQHPEKPRTLLSVAKFVRNQDVPTPDVPLATPAENGETA